MEVDKISHGQMGSVQYRYSYHYGLQKDNGYVLEKELREEDEKPAQQCAQTSAVNKGSRVLSAYQETILQHILSFVVVTKFSDLGIIVNCVTL